MPSHPLRHTLAAPQASGYEVEAIGLVGRRAGGTDRRPPVAAGLEEGGVWLPLGRVRSGDLAGCWVGVVDPAPQPYRVGAVAGGSDLLGPAVIAGTGPLDHLLENTGQQLPNQSRLAHPVPSS